MTEDEQQSSSHMKLAELRSASTLARGPTCSKLCLNLEVAINHLRQSYFDINAKLCAHHNNAMHILNYTNVDTMVEEG